MSNAKIKVGVLGQIKALLAKANTKKSNKAVTQSEPVIVVASQPKEVVEVTLTADELAEKEQMEKYAEYLVTETEADKKAAKLLAAKTKLRKDLAARVAKAEMLSSDAVTTLEIKVLEDKVAAAEMTDAAAMIDAKRELKRLRNEAIANGEVYDTSMVEAHLASKASSNAEQARLAAVLLAGRNTSVTPKVIKSYTSNAGSGGSGDAEKKPARRPIAFKALKAAGLTQEQANEVLDNTYSNKVDDYVKAQVASGKQAFVTKVAAIMYGDEGAYANRWSAYAAGTPATTSTPPAGFTAPAGNSTSAPTEGTGVGDLNPLDSADAE